MDRHLPVISRSSLFDGIDHNDLEALLHCLGARERRYPQGSAVLRVGDVTTCMGLVLEGAVRLEKEDYWGCLLYTSVCEQAVARRRAEQVVVDLEAVDVAVYEQVRLVRVAVDDHAHPLVEPAPAQQPGERVVVRNRR